MASVYFNPGLSQEAHIFLKFLDRCSFSHKGSDFLIQLSMIVLAVVDSLFKKLPAVVNSVLIKGT